MRLVAYGKLWVIGSIDSRRGLAESEGPNFPLLFPLRESEGALHPYV